MMDFVNCNNCGSKNFRLLTRTRNVGTSGKRTLNIVVCRACGLCYLNPQPTQEMYAEYYRTYGRKSRSRESLIKEKQHQKEYIDLFSTHLNKSSKILDVGCGKAILINFLKEKGYKNLFGIELSLDEIRFAKETFGLDIEYSAIEDYKEKDFDLAILVALVEHYKDPRASLVAVREVLKDGGLIFISTPNVKEMILRKGISGYFKFVHTYYFSMSILKSIVQQAGFEILEEKITVPECSRSFLFPRHYADSNLLLLARKVDRPGPLLKDDFREILKIFKRVKRRDFPAAVVFHLDQVKGLGFLFRIIRRFKLGCGKIGKIKVAN